MRSHSLPAFAFLAAALAGCGGGEERPAHAEPANAPPVESPPPAADLGPAIAPPAATQTTPPAAPPEPAKLPSVEVVPAAAPPAPDPMPKVTLDAPKVNETISVEKAADYKVKLRAANWPAAKDGPHIHLILDNKPYKAIYEPKAEVPLSQAVDNGEGASAAEITQGEHVLVAFPSTQEHISIKPVGGKSPAAAALFWVGKPGKATWKATDPTLVYSRPKGEYKGADAERITLDYYLLNVELGEKKSSVKATITPPTGDPKTVTMVKWEPYHLLNLPSGETKIRLELLDKEGKAVPGSFTTAERTIKVAREPR